MASLSTPATSPTMATSIQSTGKTSATLPDLFARLPPELRLMVYTHLGYPVSKHIWVDCPGHPQCHDNSHIVDHRDADWPMSWHAYTGVFEIRIEFKHLHIQKKRGALGPVYVQGGMK